MGKLRNILITSAGRRVSLVKIFQETLKKYNPNGMVFVVELNPHLSAAAHVADGFERAPRVTEGNYLDFLLSFCKKNDISLIVPTIDTELHILAAAKKQFLEDGILLLPQQIF